MLLAANLKSNGLDVSSVNSSLDKLIRNDTHDNCWIEVDVLGMEDISSTNQMRIMRAPDALNQM